MPPMASGRERTRHAGGAGQVTRAQLRAKLVAILRRFVPEFDPRALAPEASLRKALAADSMDILNLVVAIHDELGVDIPEDDYPKIDTLDGCLDYLAAAIAARQTGNARPR
jgi:acyl carrier protein